MVREQFREQIAATKRCPLLIAHSAEIKRKLHVRHVHRNGRTSVRSRN